MKSMSVLLASQLSNFAPILAFVFYSDTTLYAEYIFIIFTAQILWPMLTFRIEVQQQIELSQIRRRYFLGASLQTMLIWSVLFAIATLTLPLTTEIVLSLCIALALSIIGTVRSFAIGQPGTGGIMAFEALNILRNTIAFAVCWAIVQPPITIIFICAQLIHGIILVAFSLWVLRPLRRALSMKSFRQIIVTRCLKILCFTFPASLSGMLSSRLPYIALAAAHSGPATAGFIAANRMSLSPLSLILYALRIYGVKELNKRRRGLLNRFRILFWSIMLGTPIVLSPLLFPSLLKPLVANFDESWTDALYILPWLYPLSVLYFATGWMDRIFDVWGRQNVIFYIEIGVLIVASLIYVAIQWYSINVISAQVAIVSMGMLQCIAWLVAFVRIEFFEHKDSSEIPMARAKFLGKK